MLSSLTFSDSLNMFNLLNLFQNSYVRLHNNEENLYIFI